MKKIALVMMAAAMALALAACASGGSSAASSSAAASSAGSSAAAASSESASAAAASESASAASEAPVGGAAELANPWSEAESAEKAAEGAGVGYFTVPENETEIQGPVHIETFRYMEGIAEADGYVGTATMTIRKGLKQDSEDVSGDYTVYAHEWTVQAGDWEVKCFGNEEGKMMKAIWVSDNFSYSIYVRGQGDIVDTYGLEEEATIALVGAIQ